MLRETIRHHRMFLDRRVHVTLKSPVLGIGGVENRRGYSGSCPVCRPKVNDRPTTQYFY